MVYLKLAMASLYQPSIFLIFLNITHWKWIKQSKMQQGSLQPKISSGDANNVFSGQYPVLNVQRKEEKNRSIN